MDGFKNSTKTKYMCGGPVKKATGGVIKSAAPKTPTKPMVQPTPPKDVKTLVGAPKSAKTTGGEPRHSDEGISAKQRLAGTAGDYAAPPEKATATATAKPASKSNLSDAKRAELSSAYAKNYAAATEAAKAASMARTAAKKGVPVASKKPMIGLKTGGHVTKSMTKW